MVASGKIIEPGRTPLQCPILGREGGKPEGQFLRGTEGVALIDLDPETQPLPGVDLAKAMERAAAGAVDHFFGTA